MFVSRKPATRRDFLKASVAIGAGLGLAPWRYAAAAGTFPEHKMKVAIPTRAGGASDRLARTFCDVWTKHIGVPSELKFYPGAGGEVGYEVYLGKTQHDGYNLLLGNMDADVIMYVLQHPPYKYPQDYIYFCRVDSDDNVVYVAKDSPIKTIQDLVAHAKTKTVTVGTSRLPHPASIGMLVLAETTGAHFNLVPYGGSNKALNAVITGEVMCGTASAGVAIGISDQVRVLGVFSDENKLSAMMGGAPAINKVFGSHIPDLPSSRAWAIQADVLKQYPERFEKINSTMKAVFTDPDYQKGYTKTGAPWAAVQYGDREVCAKHASLIIALADRYRGIISASRK
ncbi:MAG TPA: tripartite tricarboxylate transporter substrate-binding protein [Rhodocyclaceae bacterium]|nr:tripartite tricarboxylate transporter substrate-binding protein [Rhodocyclaceae bacterium]